MRRSYGYWFLGLAFLLGTGASCANSAYSQVLGTAAAGEAGVGGMGSAAGGFNRGLGNNNGSTNLNPGGGVNLKCSLCGLSSGPNHNGSSSGSQSASYTADQLQHWLKSDRSTELMNLPVMAKMRRVTVR